VHQARLIRLQRISSLELSRILVNISGRVLSRKKKKNILTAEQLQKKLETEERRKAHITRVADEQKKSIVDKILNENKSRKEKTTESERRERLRLERIYAKVVVL
jgi:Fe2+ transport system protein B